MTQATSSRNTLDISLRMKELDDLKAKEVKDLQGQLRDQALKTVSVFVCLGIFVLGTHSVMICRLGL